ncbi:bifunctional thiamine phosphate synthase/hydroxyethylthiazole kinase [Cyberlindnera jadinii NRRL Y-1542]|uniref:TMP-TENI-domain-containing protein n=1 Tax=Cyberlindnera jadinii (strain ATCC 18201 / CBS 1600 / BCRC 20928 / JCM 3617 / NBRC 0987 / NRRL Y-1542) TaxID=983966 RepID=A0A1E4S169_CYBJN|nr:TMP-TENI-domain-containing protein [Cyberlindnera jadinii NRRL Y-1542]ODV73250.1 TMP-TENI-domain-containing protein [Cyberlindnera jadinii NRRL Y-1542]
MVDYSLYLVTDPKCPNCEEVVQDAVDNGVTIVQLREKHLDTGELIQKAERLHKITQNAGVPLIINDRIDVCLAMDAEGVHIGNDDMNPVRARELLGPDKIIGVTVHSLEELKKTIGYGCADYIGLGGIYSTQTKKMKSEPIGPLGARELYKHLKDTGNPLKSVLIAGIKPDNCERTIEQSTYHGRGADGVAVVSCIMASPTPGRVARDIRDRVDRILKNGIQPSLAKLRTIRDKNPMIHHLTNTSVQNFCANVTLAIGASPIMAAEKDEFEDLVKVPLSALVLNTSAREGFITLQKALEVYNEAGKHVVLDPEAINISSFRESSVKELFRSSPPSVVKGTTKEIMCLLGATYTEGDDILACYNIVKHFTEEFGCIVVLTGVDNLVCFQDKAYKISTERSAAAQVSGCDDALASVIASFIADIPRGDMLQALEHTVSAVACYEHCIERAHGQTPNPGSFAMELLDQLSLVDESTLVHDHTFVCSLETEQR